MLTSELMNVILPRCRNAISEADIAFLMEVFDSTPHTASGEALLTLLSDPSSRDQLLDEPQLLKSLLETPHHLSISLELYFYVLVRHSYLKAGMEDRDTADYIASVLVSYVRQRTQHIETNRFNPFGYLFDLLQQIASANGPRRFELTAATANLALVVSGVFAEHIAWRERRRAAPGLGYYQSIGEAHFKAAAAMQLAQQLELHEIFEALGQTFGPLREALAEGCERYAFFDTPPFPEDFAA